MLLLSNLSMHTQYSALQVKCKVSIGFDMFYTFELLK